MSETEQKLDFIKRRLANIEEEYDEAIQWRDWSECDLLFEERSRLRKELAEIESSIGKVCRERTGA